MNEISEHTIDIDRILSSKMGSKARFVSSLLTNWLNVVFTRIRSTHSFGRPATCRAWSGLRNAFAISRWILR